MWQNAASGQNNWELSHNEHEIFKIRYVRCDDGGGHVSLLLGNEEAKEV